MLKHLLLLLWRASMEPSRACTDGLLTTVTKWHSSLSRYAKWETCYLGKAFTCLNERRELWKLQPWQEIDVCIAIYLTEISSPRSALVKGTGGHMIGGRILCFPHRLHSPASSLLAGCFMSLCWVNLIQTPSAEHKAAETLAMEVKGHPAESQISHENLRSKNSTIINVP